MSSKSGPRATGTDGTDFKHRQRIASSIKLSVQYKFYLKVLLIFHLMVLFAMWAKGYLGSFFFYSLSLVGGELVFRHMNLKKLEHPIWRQLDLPSSYPWEYVWCLSFVPVLFAFFSFSKNRVRLLRIHYYGQFFLGILPCSIGMGSQLPELIDYIRLGDTSETPTFAGHFPMVVLWYIFFLVSFQVHGFSMYISYYLDQFWQRPANNVQSSCKIVEEKKSD